VLTNLLNIKNNLHGEELLYAVMVLLVVFLMTIDYTPFIFPIILLIFLLLIIKNNTNIFIPKTIFLFSFLIMLILLHMIIEPSEYYSFSIAQKEIVRLIVFILLVLVIVNLKIRETFFLIIWSIVFIVLFLISIFQFYDLFSINDILGFVYWDTVHLEVSKKYSDLNNFRAGSVFINFNNYSQFVVMMFSIFLFYKYKNKISNKTFIFIIIIVFVNLVLTGSRTGFLVSIFLVMITLIIYFYKNRFTLSKYIKVVLITSLFLILLGTFYSNLNFSDFRLLEVNQGIDNSLNYKYTTFLNMVREMNIIQFLIGFGPYDYQSQFIEQVDFDLGNILTYFGLAGMIFFVLFVYFTFRENKNYKKSYSLLLFYLLLVFILTSLTSGMYFNLRVFSILLLLTSTNFIEKEVN